MKFHVEIRETHGIKKQLVLKILKKSTYFPAIIHGTNMEFFWTRNYENYLSELYSRVCFLFDKTIFICSDTTRTIKREGQTSVGS